jgi:alpha-beta hydrolase superfamily lysophospholipase
MRKEIYRKAANGEGQVYSQLWEIEDPKAIVQIVHDMSEHSGRYAELASILNGAGYSVYANDLIGHGISKQGHKGAFAREEGGFDALIEDIHSLFEYADGRTGVKTEQPEKLPHILIGAGLGALLTEFYAIIHDVDAIAMLGILAAPKSISATRSLAKNQMRMGGYNYLSTGLQAHFLGTGVAEDASILPLYWLSSDLDEIAAYRQDEDCGFALAPSAYLEILNAMKLTFGKTGIRRIPKIPIAFFSGREDELGNGTEAVLAHAGELSANGHTNIMLRTYNGCKHDVLHDKCKDEFIKDLLGWIEDALKQSE